MWSVIQYSIFCRSATISKPSIHCFPLFTQAHFLRTPLNSCHHVLIRHSSHLSLPSPNLSPHVPTIDLSHFLMLGRVRFRLYHMGDHECTHFDDVSRYSGNKTALTSPEPPTFSSVASSRSVSPSQTIPPISFSTPPKLKTVEQVMNDNTGTDAAFLRRLTTVLARKAIFEIKKQR